MRERYTYLDFPGASQRNPARGAEESHRTGSPPGNGSGGGLALDAGWLITGMKPASRTALPRWLGLTYRACDSTAALAMLCLAFVISNIGAMPDGLEAFLAVRVSVKNIVLLIGFALAWRGICTLAGLYRPERIRSRPQEFAGVLAATTFATGVSLIFPAASVSGAFDYTALGLFWIGTVLSVFGLRSVLRVSLAALPKPVRHVLVVGSGPRAYEIAQRLGADTDVEYRVIGFADSDSRAARPEVRERIITGLDDLQTRLMHTAVDEVVVGLPMRSHYAEIERVIETCERLGVAVSVPADPFPTSRARFRLRRSSSMLAVTLARAPEGARLMIKRGIDIVGASVALVLFGPLMLAVAMAIKLTSRGSVLFTQERYGYNRRHFRMYKFRTMVANAEELQESLEHLNEATGPLFKIRRDPRMTLIGRFLRRTSIDELPQLFNVLRGEMSLVGPRPMAIRDVNLFPEAWLMRRFSAWPGMTGLWQVRGRVKLGYEDWAALDLRYIDEWSLLGDFKILALTVPAVIRGSGAE